MKEREKVPCMGMVQRGENKRLSNLVDGSKLLIDSYARIIRGGGKKAEGAFRSGIKDTKKKKTGQWEHFQKAI